ncbi:NADH-quinone oxidoreductase subunit L [Persicobacter psychrovividus]|uniref:NADH-quinone oxidoreductase subunit L n=1 Tax=Persicobacter psychrovividus TaxID=387638 RepID=A0ABM7VEF5_9BACT|nr:hypothetical protein PEPS_15590 [Persicobacter psychrovividus]
METLTQYNSLAIGAGILAMILPLLSFVLIAFFSDYFGAKSDRLAISAVSISLVMSVFVAMQVFPNHVITAQWSWFSVGEYQFNIGLLLDQLTAVMLVVVSLVSLLVHIFSMNYMKGEPHYARYYSFLGLFTFSMFIILLADNLLVLFMGWELVGLSSYLLIGFWFERPSAANANRKAFLTNRVGDMGFLFGIMIFWAYFHTLNFQELTALFSNASVLAQIPSTWLILGGLGIFMGTVGKSAQFPLQVWLPDAMQGPTPVSALIHAATMVAAGIFLLARVFPMLAPETLIVIALIGSITAMMGAFSALNQFDIKRVLAYSTSSQLGYMVMGMGVGAYDASLFHLITHAFFKAGLFLSVGAVIHAMHHFHAECKKKNISIHLDPQDMRQMGDLGKRMPLIHAGYTICALALIGLPFFSGFMSKDAILMASWEWAQNLSAHGQYWAWFVPLSGFGAAVLTAFYMARQWYLVFWSKSRLIVECQAACNCYDSLHDPSWKKTVPVGLLAMLSVWLVYGLNPFDGHASWLYHAVDQPMNVMLADWQIAGQREIWYVPLLALASALLGLGYAYRKYSRVSKLGIDYSHRRPKGRWGYLSINNFYMDRFYRKHFMIRSLRWAYRLHWFDKNVLDKGIVAIGGLTLSASRVFRKFDQANQWVVNAIGVAVVILGQAFRTLDIWIVDGLVNFSANLSSALGKSFGKVQGRQTQSIIAYMLCGVFILALWVLL